MNMEDALPGTRVRMLEGSQDTEGPPAGAVGTVLKERTKVYAAVQWDGWTKGWSRCVDVMRIPNCWLVRYHLLEKVEEV